MANTIIRNGKIVNRNRIVEGDLLIKGNRIEKIGGIINGEGKEIDAKGSYVIPGIIDDQVHFREPGLTYKADIASESKAALAGGVTSFMEMPNTSPPAITQELLEEKYQIASRSAYTNYSFYMGASNDNIEEVLRTPLTQVCGIKVFMGSSTGNMLVDDRKTLEALFKESPMLIATHCESEEIIKQNLEYYQQKFGHGLTASFHPLIRSEDACFTSSSQAVMLAKKYNTRLHVLHISTAAEVSLFRTDIPLEEKLITSEACVHHMHFSIKDYESLGNKIKCNPAIKSESDRKAIFQAVLKSEIDIIDTDHAPHTESEKVGHYLEAPSGLPLIQHSLNIMLDFYHRKEISMPALVEKMCHNPAICFRIEDRGFIQEGYYADLAIVDPEHLWKIERSNILYKCGWSPLEGKRCKGKVTHTFINGILAYDQGEFSGPGIGKRLLFNR